MILIFDTETTDRKEGEIIEAAWIRLKPDQGLLGPEPDRIPPDLLVEELFVNRYKPERGMTTGSALWEYSEECRIPLTCPLKRWEDVKLTDMDDSSIGWCLRQDWLDPYFRKGLERVMEGRYPPRMFASHRETVDDDIPY